MSVSKHSESIKVAVRCRPLSKKEIEAGNQRIVEMHTKRGVIEIRNPKSAPTDAPKTFTFDKVYDWNSKQAQLYEDIFQILVSSALEGYNGTIFAYGQTGTGKTFTMEGVRGDQELKGAIPRSFEHIFNHISESQNQQFLVRASYLEIYQEEIRDLLSKDQSKRLEIKERPDTGIYVKDLSSFVTKSIKEIDHVMSVGHKNRSVGATNMNEHSSRSHAIFIITIECSQIGLDGENHIRVGKLNLVDLAGSERQGKTGAKGERLKEATKINLSLSALGNVISALVDGKSTHIPYRDSKLTRLLQDSLGGNAKTVMVTNIGPADYNFDETITTLRYANRAKNIKNKPHINEDPKDALLRQFQEEISRLKSALENKGKVPGKKRSRRRKGEQHEFGSDDDEDENEDDEEDEEDIENSIEQEKQKIEEEKQALIANESMLAEEKERVLAEIEVRATELSKQKKERDALSSKIKVMESKLLGDMTIQEKTMEQEKMLEERKKKIEESKAAEMEMQKKIEAKSEVAKEKQKNVLELKQEVSSKVKEYKSLSSELENVNKEIQQAKDEYIERRQRLEMEMEELNKRLKMKTTIMENFIPTSDKEKIDKRIQWDEAADVWKLMPYTDIDEIKLPRPISAHGSRTPITLYARNASVNGNPRFRAENIVSIELDMPARTTRDYEGPTVAPRVQAALDAALQDEEDLTIDAGEIMQKRSAKSKTIKAKTGKTKKKNSNDSNATEYPKARGLISNAGRY
ncbi:Kinesin-II 95 kDa subunit [Trichoplax sp. H2]|nr:Kinesin-II 95 kDa subunit [Trichoplax sp. H2]|eukprot:RDD42004.1 Kinesin-II 95 kDa subunit [Trichoplax sp. H2]